MTLNFKQQSVTSILAEIEEQTGLRLLYSKDLEKDLDKKANLVVNNEEVRGALQRLFEQTSLTFKIQGGSILIMKGAPVVQQPMNRANASAAGGLLEGVVKDTDGNVLQGANVEVKGTPAGAVSNAKGMFRLYNVKPADTLTVALLGFRRKEVLAAGKSIVISLEPSVSILDETVVIAYAPTSQRFSTYNLSVVKAKNITMQPVTNPLQALAGRVSGVFIQQVTGSPGSGQKVSIQGLNSLQKSNDPLYIVDGVVFTARLPYTLAIIQGGSGSNGLNVAGVQPGAGSPLEYINPADIETMIVLKDAAAAALYGSRAANGAIIITTKKGKTGKPRYYITAESGWGVVARKMRLLNTTQYLKLRADAYGNDGKPVPGASTSADQNNLDLSHYDSTRYTDWQKELIGGTAQYRNLHAAVSGGGSFAKYYASLGHHRQTTVFPGDLGDSKTSLHVNLEHGSENTRFKMLLTTDYLQGNTTLIAEDLTKDAMSLAPNAPAVKSADGTLNWDTLPNGDAGWTNPLAYLKQRYHNTTSNLLTAATLSYELLPRVNISSAFGYNRLQANDKLAMPLSAYTPQERFSRQSTLQVAAASLHTWTMDPQLSFHTTTPNSTYSAAIGYTFQEQNATRTAIEGKGFAMEDQMTDIAAAMSKDTGNNNAYYRFSAIYGAFNGKWSDRYIVSLSLRQDRSSRMGKTNRSHIFGSAAAAWIFTKEKPVQRMLPFLSFGKLRAAYCFTGNDGVLEEETFASSTLLGNRPQQQWEEISKFSPGLDLGFWADRLLIGVTYYHNRSSNRLLDYTESTVTGQPAFPRSLSALVQNTGWELEIQATEIPVGKCKWSAEVSLTIPQTRLLAFNDLENSSFKYDYAVRQPVNLVRAYQFAGVDPETGLNRIFNRKGEILAAGTLGEPEDRVVNIDLGPRFYGGLHNQITYKTFALDVFFQFVKQQGPLYNWGDQPGQFSSIANTGNQPAAVLNAWHKTGDITSISKASSVWTKETNASYINGMFSTAVYGDASYIRLKNLSLSYTFNKPGGYDAKLTCFIHAQNLLTVTRYKGLDPETKSAVSLPPLKMISLGANLAF
ncbi:SusC/RagA family TonB-linked outer membrane protein [Chitinophaga rupis]|uniref:SusC/RagA family TonB-linked outer membrane protein n=1 Tax=Chitinophaga rupis TaxID=573321 RepID=UPI00138FCED9|nr:SusC/RagA family TonB-linked outer membrane protein [Chitinophaga rupis]